MIIIMMLFDIGYDIIDPWYHKSLISWLIQDHDIIYDIINNINVNITDIGFDILELWYHKFLISYMI
jgi:hypothetical protein